MRSTTKPHDEPRWMRPVLVAAGLYNLAWGAAAILLPEAIFRIAGMELPRYPQIWQCVGMIVGVYGLGYLIAATDPLRHWPITLVGLLGKIFGPIGFAGALISGQLPLAFGATIITNDLIWWLPFAAILYQAFKQANDRSSSERMLELSQAIATVTSHRGATLADLSWESPTLVIFLRHTGCTFCRETLADVMARRRELEARGLTLALVHMSDPLHATQFFSAYRLQSLHRFSDPQCTLYRAFGLERGTFQQLFGFRVWVRGFAASLLKGHGLGTLNGDGFRMPGVFLIDRGSVTAEYRATSSADQLDLLAITSHVQPRSEPQLRNDQHLTPRVASVSS